MEKYQRPKNYFGEYYDQYYVLLSRHRDSSILEESNFLAALGILGLSYDNVPSCHGDDSEPPHPCIVARANHWAVGWVELLLIHESSSLVDKGKKISESLEDYPVLDDELYSVRQLDAADSLWESMSIGERVETCQKNGLSIFMARRNYMPTTTSGEYLIDPEEC